ncbi:MAG: hypothetical protein ACOX6T_14190 [Myxococcales bacterium]
MADLDADGSPEIVVGASVFDARGGSSGKAPADRVRWARAPSRPSPTSTETASRR